MQNFLKYSMVFAYGRSFSYHPALSQKVVNPGSVHSSSSGTESRDSDSDISDDERDIENGHDNSIISRLESFVVTDCF